MTDKTRNIPEGVKLDSLRYVDVTFPDGSMFFVLFGFNRKFRICSEPGRLDKNRECLSLTQAQETAIRILNRAEAPTTEDKALWNECVRLLEEA